MAAPQFKNPHFYIDNNSWRLQLLVYFISSHCWLCLWPLQKKLSPCKPKLNFLYIYTLYGLSSHDTAVAVWAREHNTSQILVCWTSLPAHWQLSSCLAAELVLFLAQYVVKDHFRILPEHKHATSQLVSMETTLSKTDTVGHCFNKR